MQRIVAGIAAGLLVVGTLIGLGAPTASADTPPPGVLSTVTQDALPTVQINGVVWDQVTVGNTVYAVGDFSSARPAGSPAGQNETPRTDILAYDITTGNLITSFNHTLNGQVQTIAASPDGSRIYIGGQFTTVDGQNRYRIAAFDTSSGDLVSSFAPAANAGVSAIAATNSTVYFGGNFGVVNGNTRTRLAAVTSAGALTSWAPSADNTVNAMVVNPAGTKVVAAGRFANLNTTSAHGIGALNVNTGATASWGMSQVTTDGANDSGMLTLSTDGTYIYTGGYTYSSGDFEGTAALNPNTGDPVWINDCWGDTYSTYPDNGVLYVSSHAHSCAAPGWFPDSSNWHFGLAYGTAPTSNHNTVDGRGWNYSAYRTSTLQQWNPTFAEGSFTGTDQATWSVTGNGNYVAFGGEFPSVNGTAQQGLVRFTTHANAPNAYGPSGISTVTASAAPSGTVTVTASQGAYDPDDGYLTYQLIRDGNTASPVATKVVKTPGFWQTPPAVSLTDTTAAAGSTHTYRLRVVDGGGKATGTNTLSVTSR